MSNHYKHDVDIRSTQLSKGLGDARDYIVSRVLFGFALFVLVLGGAHLKQAIENQIGRNTKKLFNLREVVYAYDGNRARYKEQWHGKFAILKSMRILKIKEYSIILEPLYFNGNIPVSCQVSNSQSISSLFPGNKIDVQGKVGFYGYGDELNRRYELKLYDCRHGKW